MPKNVLAPAPELRGIVLVDCRCGRTTMLLASHPLLRFSKYILIGEECWEWTAYKDAHGYGRFWLGNGKRGTASRAAWRLFVGPIPPGFEVDHVCKNPSCVNPTHLRAITKSENLGNRNLAKTHCRNGHPLDDDNILSEMVHGKKARRCKICRQRRKRDEYRRRNQGNYGDR